MKAAKHLALLIVIFALAACEPQTETVTYSSPNEKVTLTFSATRTNSLDPWTVNITVKGFNYDETVMTELYANEINKETIVVNWQDDNNAIIVLKQRDGDSKVMTLFINENKVLMQ